MSIDQNVSYSKAKKIGEYYLIFLLIFIAGVVSAGRLLGIGADYGGYIELFTYTGLELSLIHI